MKKAKFYKELKKPMCYQCRPTRPHRRAWGQTEKKVQSIWKELFENEDLLSNQTKEPACPLLTLWQHLPCRILKTLLIFERHCCSRPRILCLYPGSHTFAHNSNIWLSMLQIAWDWAKQRFNYWFCWRHIFVKISIADVDMHLPTLCRRRCHFLKFC